MTLDRQVSRPASRPVRGTAELLCCAARSHRAVQPGRQFCSRTREVLQQPVHSRRAAVLQPQHGCSALARCQHGHIGPHSARIWACMMYCLPPSLLTCQGMPPLSEGGLVDCLLDEQDRACSLGQGMHSHNTLEVQNAGKGSRGCSRGGLHTACLPLCDHGLPRGPHTLLILPRPKWSAAGAPEELHKQCKGTLGKPQGPCRLAPDLHCLPHVAAAAGAPAAPEPCASWASYHAGCTGAAGVLRFSKELCRLGPKPQLASLCLCPQCPAPSELCRASRSSVAVNQRLAQSSAAQLGGMDTRTTSSS